MKKFWLVQPEASDINCVKYSTPEAATCRAEDLSQTLQPQRIFILEVVKVLQPGPIEVVTTFEE